ncbi:MAG: carbon starvation CstA family protein, partial [Phycisphaerae bacterium]
YDLGIHRYLPMTGADGASVVGAAAWSKYYGSGAWSAMTLPKKIGGFIEGGANIMTAVGVPVTMGIAIMAVLVASFAATTLDTATRLQRYIVSELGAAMNIRSLSNRYAATAVAVGTGGAIAMIAGPTGPGSGGLILWPIFGATNQILAGLSFLVICFYLLRHNKPVWFLVPPMLLMLILPAWVLSVQLFGPHGWIKSGAYLLAAMGLFASVLQIWMMIEGLLLFRKIRGVAPEPLGVL